VSDKQQPLPSLAPERDQVAAYRSSRSDSKGRAPAPSGGGGSAFTTILLFIVFIAIGLGGWWFDMQNKTFKAQIASAEARIQELENRLSATGEELGESSVVIKTRLSELAERTDELWKQMDKLWASAWRRNQAEIKDLETQLSQQSKTISSLSTAQKNSSESIKSVANKQTETDFNLGILSEQIEAAKNLSSDLDSIKQRISKLETSGINKDQTQIELAGNVAQIERQLNQIRNDLNRLQSRPTPPGG
jgi:chromosome segregation ATPase